MAFVNKVSRSIIATEPAAARFASLDDVPKIVEILAAMHHESRYAAWPLEPEKLRGLVQGLIGYKDGACIVVEEAGELVGVLLGLVMEFFFSRQRVASELVHYMRPAFRGSLAETQLAQWFIEWAEATDAVEIQSGGWVGVPELEAEAFYSGLGFTSSCRSFAKEISHVRS